MRTPPHPSRLRLVLALLACGAALAFGGEQSAIFLNSNLLEYAAQSGDAPWAKNLLRHPAATFTLSALSAGQILPTEPTSLFVVLRGAVENAAVSCATGDVFVPAADARWIGAANALVLQIETPAARAPRLLPVTDRAWRGVVDPFGARILALDDASAARWVRVERALKIPAGDPLAVFTLAGEGLLQAGAADVVALKPGALTIVDRGIEVTLIAKRDAPVVVLLLALPNPSR